MGGQAATFRYQGSHAFFDVTVTPGGDSWKVSVVPASAGSPAPATPSAATPPPALEIERTSYGSVGSTATPAAKRPASISDSSDESIPVARAVSQASPAPADPSAPAAAPSAPALDRSSSDWIDNILRRMMDAGSSDVHLSSDALPYWRVDGEIEPIPGEDVLEPAFLEKQIMSVAPADNQEEFGRRNDTDFAYEVKGLSRFRVNVFRDRKGVGTVMRTIPFEIPSAEKLGVPEVILDMANLSKGLVLVTGPTGSGKSTTLAALIDHINRTRKCHLITVEDPVEFVHPNKLCLVNQREIHRHTNSFKDALRAALREDPDIVLVGEMRDLETIEIAVETAETGHLVFGTLHTTTAPSTVDRIIDQFPADRQDQIRQMLASSLKGVVAQVLCKKKGGGRVAAHEILVGTSAVSNLIREAKTFQLFSLMQVGRKLGMRKMEDTLLRLVKEDLVEPMEAYRKANNKQEFAGLLKGAGIKIDVPD
ncbi:MAG: PilT/PilU family type 4a pilus ATPase [Myxococcales bacterium]|nr:PilT/PilU family type 4a pilus ATPase [Myxococcales bacterium]